MVTSLCLLGPSPDQPGASPPGPSNGWEIPVDIDRDDAARRAAGELADPRYAQARPGPIQELGQWLGDLLNKLLSSLSQAVPGGIFGLLLVLALLIVLVVVVRLKTGEVARAARASQAVFGVVRRSAADYRRSAAEAATNRQYADAVREQFRAIVRALEERALLDPRSGRTADEAAAEGGMLLPNVAEGLRAAARLFDDVHYGARPTDEAGYRSLVELDERCRRERPAILAGA